MNKTNITYDQKDTHTHAGQYDASYLDRLLPEWIQDLKHYFENQSGHNYSTDAN